MKPNPFKVKDREKHTTRLNLESWKSWKRFVRTDKIEHVDAKKKQNDFEFKEEMIGIY